MRRKRPQRKAQADPNSSHAVEPRIEVTRLKVPVNLNPFVAADSQPLIQGLSLRYMVSGEPLKEQEAIQVIVRLPFCLYIASARYLVNDPLTGTQVGFESRKVWTDRAEGSTILSAEAMAPGKTVYLNGSEITTEQIGNTELVHGALKGRNVEFDKDPAGYFQFTRLMLELDWTFPHGFANPGFDKEKLNNVVDEISIRVLDIVNHIVDTYRAVTGDGYIQRLSYLAVEDIRIGIPESCSIRKEPNLSAEYRYKCGIHPYAFSLHGICPAIVNKPREIIEAFASALKTGSRPETWKLLHLNAEAALDQRDSKLAVIESFLALEVYVEEFFRQRLVPSMTADEIEDLLTREDHWRLQVRLKKLLKEKFSHSISDIDNTFWQNWCDAYKARNALVHRGLVPTLEESRGILDLNRRVIQVLESL